MKMSLLLSRK